MSVKMEEEVTGASKNAEDRTWAEAVRNGFQAGQARPSIWTTGKGRSIS